MRQFRKAFFVSIVVLAFFSISLSQSNFNVKTGLWEDTVTTQMSGMPAMPQIPPDALARMTPEQRARIQAAMSSGMGNGQPHTYQSCLTKEKLAEGFRPDGPEKANCKRTLTRVSATSMDIKEQCSERDATVDVTIHVEARSSDETSGTMHMVITHQGQTMTSDGTFHGKYLGPDCGSVK